MNGFSNVVYTYVENYSDFKKKEILPFVATWINTQVIIISKISQL